VLRSKLMMGTIELFPCTTNPLCVTGYDYSSCTDDAGAWGIWVGETDSFSFPST
jgi:hypothetical protein